MTAAQRRAQLLDVTRELVGEQGFHAVSIEAVARRAGITRPVVYGHFGDLAGLLDAMLSRETERALGKLAAVLPPPDGGAGELLAAFRGYLEVVEGEPLTWRLVLMPPEGAPESLQRRINQGREAVVAALAQFTRLGRESPDPQLTGHTLSALADESARLLLTDRERYPVDRLIAHASWLLARLTASHGGEGSPG